MNLEQMMQEREVAQRSPYAADRSDWGAHFSEQFVDQMSQSREWQRGEADMIQVRKTFMARAKSDEQKRELNIEWAGVTLELAVREIAIDLEKEGKVKIYQKAKEKFDLRGGADLVLLDDESKTAVGIQIKGFTNVEADSEGVYLFDATDKLAMEEMLRQVTALKGMKLLNEEVEIKNQQADFAAVALLELGSEYKPRLIYALVDRKSINKTKGKFYPSDKAVIKEALELMIRSEALTVMHKSLRVKA